MRLYSIGAMERTLRGLRGVTLTLLVLGAFNYAHLVVSLGTTLPYVSGIGRIGRDLTRRSIGDEKPTSHRGLNEPPRFAESMISQIRVRPMFSEKEPRFSDIFS